MKYRNLGKSGLKVSELSFGSWVTFNKQVDTSLAEKMFGTCLDAGINFFDQSTTISDLKQIEINNLAFPLFFRS